MNFTDSVNFLVRNVVRTTMGMPANSVRPARQLSPTGKAGEEFATVFIPSFASWDYNLDWQDVINPTTGLPDPTRVRQNVTTVTEFDASVNFYRSREVDTKGVPGYGSNSFDRARRLGNLIWQPPALEVLNRYGIACNGVSDARNLTELVDAAVWESRGQIDLTLTIVDLEPFILSVYDTVRVGLQVAWPGGRTDTTPIEVTNV